MKGKLGVCLAIVLIGSLVLGTVVVSAQTVKRITVGLEAGFMSDGASLVAPDFEKAHPDIKVTVVPIPYTAFRQKVIQELSAGSGAYDIVGGYLELNASYIAAGWVVPLDKYVAESDIDTNDFIPSFYNLGTLFGRASQLNPAGDVYGLPFNGDVMMLIFRKDLYALNGLTPPRTWEEFVKNVTKLNQPKDDLYGMAVSGARANDSHVMFDFYSFALNMDGTLPLGEGNKPQVYSPGNVRALQLYVDLVNKYKVTPPGVREYRYAEKNAAVAQGKATHMVQWMLACAGELEDPDQSRVHGKVGYTTMPGGGSVVGGWSILIADACKYPKEAFEFLKFLSIDSDARISLAYGKGPVLKSSAQDPEMIKKYPYIADYVKAATNGMHMCACSPALPLWLEITDILNFGFADAVFEGVPVEGALKRIDKEMTELLKEEGFLG